MTRAAAALLLLIGAGCGTDPCPDPADPNVRYVEGSRADPARCQVIRFACEEGEAAFSDDCGCGCIRTD
jgi:hypothetical protein